MKIGKERERERETERERERQREREKESERKRKRLILRYLTLKIPLSTPVKVQRLWRKLKPAESDTFCLIDGKTLSVTLCAFKQ